MSVIGVLKTLVTADTTDFDKKAKKTKMSLSSIGDFAKSGFSKVGAIGAAIGIGVVVAGLQQLTSAAMTSADDLATAAGLIGTTTKSLSELHHAAVRSDVDVNTLDASLKKLNVNLAEAATTGKGATAEALKELGLSANDLSAMDPADAMKAIADGIAGVDNPAKKAALAMDIFGKAGVDMVSFLSQGSAGIEELQEEARKLGVSLDDVDAARINQANDAMDKVGAAMSGVGQQIAIGVAPFITDLAEKFLDTGIFGQVMGNMVMQGLELAVSAIGVVLDVMDVFRDAWYGLQGVITLAISSSLLPLKLLAQGLDWILEKTTGVSSGAGQFFQTLEEEFERSAKESFEQFDENFTARTPSEDLQSWFDGVKAKSAAMTTEVKKGSDAIGQVSEEMIKAQESARGLVDKLQLQIDTFGMSSTAAEIYKLKQQGADATVLAQAESLAGHIEQLEEAKKAQEELAESAKSVLAEIATPQEKYNEKIRELETLYDNGLLTAEGFGKAQKKAKDDILGETDTTVNFAGAMNDVAARSAVLRFEAGAQNKDTGINGVVTNTAKQLEEQKQMRQLMGKMVTALADGDILVNAA